MGIGQLIAGLSVPQASPVVAVGQAAIDLTPTPVKTWATSSFGTADKDVLLTGVVVVLAVLAGITGALAVRRLAYGMWGVARLPVGGVAAPVTRPGSSPGWALPVLIGAAVGAFALTRLVRLARAVGTSPQTPAPLPRIVFGGGADSPPGGTP